jgi:hypothetical protein
MGRRSRARDRAAASVAAPAGPATAAREPGWRRWVRLLNPFAGTRPTRSRARGTAVVFGVAAVLAAVVGRVTVEPAWYSSAVLLAILAVVWGLASAVLGDGDRSG